MRRELRVGMGGAVQDQGHEVVRLALEAADEDARRREARTVHTDAGLYCPLWAAAAAGALDRGDDELGRDLPRTLTPGLDGVAGEARALCCPRAAGSADRAA